jgi:hypothetical protein
LGNGVAFEPGEDRVKTLLLVVLGVAAAILGAWEFWLSPFIIRYRLTIDVAVGDEIKRGSGVIETTWDKSDWFGLDGRPWAVDVTGQAVVIDLGGRGLLFSLLTWDGARPPLSNGSNTSPSTDPASFLVAAFTTGRIIGTGTTTADMLAEIERRRDVVEVAPSLLPMLVRFRNLKDPASVERVDPGDLAGIYGPDVKLVRVTAQVVPTGIWPLNRTGRRHPQWLIGEPVTTGIKSLLPWLDYNSPQGWITKDHGAADMMDQPEHFLRYYDFMGLSNDRQ